MREKIEEITGKLIRETRKKSRTSSLSRSFDVGRPV